MLTTPLMIEQHMHGAFGVDFNTVKTINDVHYVAQKLLEHGIGGFFPTLVTDKVENIKTQIQLIKKAAETCPQILGIHLEGIFINPEKKGIHNPTHFLKLTADNYKLIEDDFIKIITLAPELDEGLIDYLTCKKIKIQAGHCISGDLRKVDGVTHLYNAMGGINHREEGTALSALVDDKIYTEIIADGYHVNDNALKLLFKSKPNDKILLISDSLPITHSDIKEAFFADSKIFYNGKIATSADGTIAGSTILLDGIVKRLGELGLYKEIFAENPYNYHNLEPKGKIIWNESWQIKEVIHNR